MVKQGAEVKVLMTNDAKHFITPLTLATLSKNPVLSDVSNGESWNNHVELGLWADALIIAPATANTLAKMAQGICDNILLAVYLSAKCPVFFAPAMDLDMWKHPATQTNIQTLLSYGNQLIPVGDGELASGLVGKGRMAEPEDIVSLLSDFFKQNESPELLDKKVLITSGPTHEPIDPVRFIGNRSTGKMGKAVAEEFAKRGAHVIFVSGPTPNKGIGPNIKCVPVRTAEEMHQACLTHYPTVDIAVLAAAVADYTPKEVATEKIKKKEGDLFIELKRTTDIAKALGAQKQSHQINVGFALETQNAVDNAKGKLHKKNFDCIVLNSLKDKGAGFGHDTNKITILDHLGTIQAFELKSKQQVAVDIVNKVVELLQLQEAIANTSKQEPKN